MEEAFKELDAASWEAMKVDQLQDYTRRLREEAERVREKINYDKLERDKVLACWEIVKKRVQETKATVRNQWKTKADAEDHHRVEINTCREELRQVLSEQHDAVSEMKIDAVASSSLIQNTASELGLRQSLQSEPTEEFYIQSRIKEMQLEHRMNLMKLHKKYDIKFQAMEQDFLRMTDTVIEREKKKTEDKFLELDKDTTQQKNALMKKFYEEDQALRDKISEARDANAEKLKELRIRLDKKKRANRVKAKEELKNREKFQALKKKVEEDQRGLQELESLIGAPQDNLKRLKTHLARRKQVEKEFQSLSVEDHFVEAALDAKQEEMREAQRRHNQNILDIKQKSSLKMMCMELKLAALKDATLKEEAFLRSALSQSSADPTERSAADKRLQEILESKRAKVDHLQNSLFRDSDSGSSVHQRKQSKARKKQNMNREDPSTLEGKNTRRKHQDDSREAQKSKQSRRTESLGGCRAFLLSHTWDSILQGPSKGYHGKKYI